MELNYLTCYKIKISNKLLFILLFWSFVCTELVVIMKNKSNMNKFIFIYIFTSKQIIFMLGFLLSLWFCEFMTVVCHKMIYIIICKSNIMLKDIYLLWRFQNYILLVVFILTFSNHFIWIIENVEIMEMISGKWAVMKDTMWV